MRAHSAILAVAVFVCAHALLAAPDLAILFWVVPTFQTMFAEMGATLPLPTALVLQVSGTLRACWWVLPPFALAEAVR